MYIYIYIYVCMYVYHVDREVYIHKGRLMAKKINKFRQTYDECSIPI